MKMELGLSKGECRILVVDDQPMVLDVVARMLEQLGYPVDTAEGSREAIFMLTGSTYRLVITDFSMPIMNGYQLAGWIKQHHPRTRVVIMTGCSSVDMAGLKNSCVIDAFLFKPIGLTDLCNLLSDLSPEFDVRPLSEPPPPTVRMGSGSHRNFEWGNS
ncbi:MAG: response regulator [Pseudomonadota bacterium]